MQDYQFESELAHLERVVPLLAAGGNPLGLPYWRSRITALSRHKSLVPEGRSRLTRLVRLFDEIESESRLSR